MSSERIVDGSTKLTINPEHTPTVRSESRRVDNRYKIIKELGSGLSGEVFLVESADGPKALKFLKRVQMGVSREEALENFKNEFSILSELNHPGIARILDFGFDSPLMKYYFTTELIEGEDFIKATEGKSIDEIEALAVQVLRALNYLHSRGIYHLDIKPQNILVQKRKVDAGSPSPQPSPLQGEGAHKELTAKLIDFGLSGLAKKEKRGGTPAYMPPEIILGERPDGRSDLYSLGVLLYKGLTRENPFIGKDRDEIFRKQQTLIPKPPSEVNPAVPKYWDLIIARLLKKTPSERHPQASFVIRDINFLAGKNYEIETADTRLSYLPEKGNLIGRKKETEIFKRLFGRIFTENDKTAPRLLIVEGGQGTGKSRLVTELKYFSQLHNVPTVSWRELSAKTPPPPFCLFIDEADEATPNAVNRLLQKASGEKMFILWGVPKGPAGWTRCEKISLQNFTAEEIEQYLVMVTGLEHPPQKLVREISSRTDGNPLFVTEILKTLLSGNLLFDGMGRWTGPTLDDIGVDFEKIKIPKTVEELLKERYAGLPDEQKKVLEWMAVINAPATLQTVRGLAKIDKPEGLFLALTREDLIERAEPAWRVEPTGGYFFKNPLLREVIYGSLPEEKRQALHDAVAALTEGNGKLRENFLNHRGHGRDTVCAVSALRELADHLKKTERFGAAVAVLVEAQRRSAGLDFETRLEVETALAEATFASRNYRRAVERYEHLRRMIEEQTDGSDLVEKKITIYEKLGDLFVRLGQFTEALALFQSALERLPDTPRSRVHSLVLENHMANVHLRSGQIDKAEEIFRKNLAVCENDLPPAEKQRVVNNRLAMTLAVKNDFAGAKAMLEKDIAFFTKIKNDYLLAQAHYELGDLSFKKMTVETGPRQAEEKKNAVAAFEKCRLLAKKIPAFDLLLRAHNGMGNLYHHEKEYDRSLECYERALALARKEEEPITESAAALNMANIYKVWKKYPDAYSYLVYTINLLEDMEPKGLFAWQYLLNAYVEIGEIHRETGELEKAEEALNSAEKILRGQGGQLIPYEFWICLEKARTYHRLGKETLFNASLHRARDLAVGPLEKEHLKKFEDEIKIKPLSLRKEKPMTEQNNETAGAFEKILEINRLINAEHHIDALLKMVLHYALELSGGEAGLILLINDDGELEVKASFNTATNPELVKFSTSVAKKVLETGEAVALADAIVDEQFKSSESIILNDMKSILCLPIRSRNKVIGVFYLDNRYQAGAFHKVNRRVLAAFCDQVGIAIENARLIASQEEAKKDLEEKLEKTSEELSEVMQKIKTETSLYFAKYSYSQIISKSRTMQEVFKVLDKVTETNLSIYLFGPSGTGKELIARALHYNNPQRAKRSFVAINCGAIPSNLIESELFGYKAGSFTGAVKDKKGLFAEADGGTLFLDEIGELEPSLQVKLLRVLQEGEVQPIGGLNPFKVDVRVVSASHRDVQEMIREGKFRDDLFYRLCQITLTIPALSERKEDIPLLVDHFVEKFRQENKVKKPIRVSPPFLKVLLPYDWPGNVRELENLVSVACALRTGDSLSESSIPPNHPLMKGAASGASIPAVAPAPAASAGGEKVPIDEKNFFDPQKTWADYEKVILAKCYEACAFKKMPSAQMIGLSHSTLYKKIDEFRLDEKDNPLYKDPFVYEKGKALKDYIPLIFQAALASAGNKPYTAIRQLAVSQGYFYKILKGLKQNAA